MGQPRLDDADALKNDGSLLSVHCGIYPLRPWKPASLFKDAQCVQWPPCCRQHFGQIDSKKARLGKSFKTCSQDDFGFGFQSHPEQNFLYQLIGLFA